MSNTTNTLKQMYWLNGQWVYVDAENANNLDMLDSTDFASNITEKRVDHSSMHMVLGNNNWGQLLYNISSDAIASASYNASEQGMAFTGVNKQYGIATHIPIDPLATYLIKVRVKRISGDGYFSLGAISLNNNFEPIGEHSFCVANNMLVTTITDISGKISGYNLNSETNANKFANNANYFDIVFHTGSNGGNASSVYVIQSLEIIKIQNEMYVGSGKVWHEGNFVPSSKADVTYVNSELEERDTEINKKLPTSTFNTHTSTVGLTSLGHVKNGGNVTVASDGKMNTTPSAIGAYTKAETDSAIDADIATHAGIVGQTNLGHVKNGGNITIAPDGKVNTTPSAIGAFTKSETENLIAAKLTDKVYVDAHIADNVKHVTPDERTKWNAKADANGSTAKDFNARQLNVSSHILPTGNSTQNIGSPTNRFKAIYVDEAYLSTNTLYLGDIPILGTDADTVNIKTDPDQSICMKTSATGTTTVTSEKAVAITTSGMNSNVTIQTTGVNSQANIAATAAVNINAPTIKLTGTTNVDGDLTAKNLNITGNFTVGGTLTTVNATNLEISDNIIDINKGETGQGVAERYAGMKIDRGDLNDILLVFDENDDKFKVGDSSNLLPLATEKYVTDNRYVHPAGTNPHGTTKSDVGLGNVTNESKTTMFTSPSFTGTPVAPTAADNNNTTQIATTAFVMRESAKKANASHGNHVPTTQTANSLVYLRNDNTWQTLPSASTSIKGVVQLNNNINSTATDQAATASAVKITYDLAASKASTTIASSSTNGLMSKEDKAKLDAISPGAGVNQNAFSHVKVGSTTVSADTATDTIELVAGNGITITPDATNDKITITGVNQYTHPTSDGNKHVPANGTTNSGKFLQATATAGTYQWATLPTASTSIAGIIQIGTGATNAAAGNHSHNYLPLSGGTLTGNLTINTSLTIGQEINRYVGSVSFTNPPVAKERFKVIIPGGTAFGAYFKLRISGSWCHGNNFGLVEKSFGVYLNGTGDINQKTGYTELTGYTRDNIAISDIQWDETNKEYYIVVAKINDSSDGILHVSICGRLNTAIISKMTLSGIFTDNISYSSPKLSDNGSTLYTTSNKPTPADIGAATAGHTHNDLSPISHNHDTVYFKKTGGTISSQLVILGTAASNPLVARGIQGSDGNGGLGPLYLNYNNSNPVYINGENKVYHQGFKPTAADVGASPTGHTHSYLPLGGGTLTGTLVTASDKFFTNGVSGINLKNSDIVGVNTIVFADESDGNEGLLFPKAGKLGTSTTATDFDVIKSYQSVLYYNTNKVYHQGFKPTPADIGASPTSHNHDSSYASSSHSHTTLQSSNPVTILNGSSAQKISTGGVLASGDYGDASKVPTYGVYAKGNIHTEGEVKIKTSGMRYNETTECIEFYFV